MNEQALDSLEKVRKQFDAAPYPRAPLDFYPRNIQYLYIHNLVTPYYLRNQKVVETEGKVILDAGCGTGYKTLALAVANPGAKIVGIDLSEESVKLARQRLQYHGFEEAEFYPLSIEDLPKLDREFDYINNDEVLYLLSNPAAGLEAMKSVLKPDGIIRTNLHSSLQRENYYRAQEVFKMLGLLDDNPEEAEIEQVREIMKTLKDDALLKVNTWIPAQENDQEWLIANYLLQGDKGYTIPEVFSALRAADLEFVSVVNWPQWELMDLFIEPDNLPVFLGISLPGLSLEEQLHLFELLHPIHRLLDFWCGHSNAAKPVVPVAEWTALDWQGALVHIHPQMKATQVREELVACATQIQSFAISQYLPFAKDPALLMDSAVAACIIPLLDRPQRISSLVEQWLQVRPVHPVTLQPTEPEVASQTVKQMLTTLEEIGFVLLERRPGED